ncbi:MAG: type II CRISPR RNA-guided endonuclease Cas9, partial [Bacteroidetes bacterium]
LNAVKDIDEDILKISKTAQPSTTELTRYKLWLEQKYRSPYTGEIIPLTKLFTANYEIEHIIPQSRYFDDSLSNKVICEGAVNKLKDNQLGLEFIKNNKGRIIETGFGKSVRIFNEAEYTDFVNQHYAKNRSKQRKLMLEEIPDKMIERQLNDTRYISKYISSILSNIVRADNNDDGINSKNVIPGNGKITNELKNDWGLNDVWNDLILPRFERMNALTNSNTFTTYNEKYQKYIPTVPIEFSKGFQKKRIDHRHHAMDALVIACATRDHVNLLNNKHAKSDVRFDLNRKLRVFEKVSYKDANTGKKVEKEVPKAFVKPWPTFTVETKNVLNEIIVSFKQNLRVINKATNYYESYKDENGNLMLDKEGRPTKAKIKQHKGEHWAIRKPLHQETVAGLIKLKKTKTVSFNSCLNQVEFIVNKDLRKYLQHLVSSGLDNKKIITHVKGLGFKINEIDCAKVEVYYWDVDEQGLGVNAASRSLLDVTFNEKRIAESIADTAIQKILLAHINNYVGRKDEKGKLIPAELLAFSPEGIEEMNKNIISLNKGKFHQPIYKVSTYEARGNKFSVGFKGNKSSKYVIAAKGTNIFFAIYEDVKGKRYYETIPFNLAIERQKQGLSSVPQYNAENFRLLMVLSPNDLVYVSADKETIDLNELTSTQKQRIYKIVSFTGNRLYAVPFVTAKSIVDKLEFTQLNKMEFDLNKVSIKEHCIKLNVDRLGNLKKG